MYRELLTEHSYCGAGSDVLTARSDTVRSATLVRGVIVAHRSRQRHRRRRRETDLQSKCQTDKQRSFRRETARRFVLICHSVGVIKSAVWTSFADTFNC